MQLAFYRNCLKYTNGAGYVAVDQASGGYPYPVTIDNAMDFPSKDEAVEYAHIVKAYGPFEFVSVRVTFSHEEE